MLFPNADVVINPFMLLLLGTILGTLSGFFGVGGGFLITGGLLVLGVPTLFAVGTGLTLIMGASIINTLKHRSLGNVDFRLGMITLVGTIPALFLAVRLNNWLESVGAEGPAIKYTYVVVLALLGLFIVYDYYRTRGLSGEGPDVVSTTGLARRLQDLRIGPRTIKLPGLGALPTRVALPASGITEISVFVPVAIGFFVGFFAGLLGAGGGFILLPIFIYLVGVPTTVAIGTGLFQIIVTGSLGTFLYSLDGNVDPLMAVILLGAASLGSQLGATATRFIEARRIRILFGATLLSAAVAVGLEQASTAGDGVDILSTIALVVLFGVAGTICVVIAVMMIVARRDRPVLEPVER